MRPFFLLSLLLLCGCSQEMDSYGNAVSQKRQKQKLIVLQKKIETAEREQIKVQEDVAALKEGLRQSELEMIRKTVEDCEFRLARHQKDSHVAELFLEEREILHRMIQSGSAPTSFEAQVVLDQILRIITNLSEHEE